MATYKPLAASTSTNLTPDATPKPMAQPGFAVAGATPVPPSQNMAPTQNMAPMQILRPQDTEPVGKNAQFDVMRQQANNQQNVAAQGQQDALNRRLASLGNLNSGAALAQSQNLESGLASQREKAMGDINVSEAADTSQRQNQAYQGQLAQQQHAYDSQVQQTQANRAFDASQASNAFNEGLASKEDQLNDYMTKYNASLSLGTSDHQDEVKNAFQSMFPTQDMAFGGNPGSYDSTQALIRRNQILQNGAGWNGPKDQNGKPIMTAGF